jgi:hypothetical protein
MALAMASIGDPSTSKAFLWLRHGNPGNYGPSFMGENPAFHKGNNLPVDNVSWDQITGRLAFWNASISSEVSYQCFETAKTHFRFRLPSESEWEYAAEGGPQLEGGPCFQREQRTGRSRGGTVGAGEGSITPHFFARLADRMRSLRIGSVNIMPLRT